ncbi:MULTISPECIES: restriction endonuclease subunit S [unclassified Mucilaginibacter]|uniref:restriction endonuclease subunit S n=1 Tax=unclassified Mucilaginibacter TaxID=2617802 RepID=UPI0033923D1A
MKPLESIFDISVGGDVRKENVCEVKSEIFQYPIYANAEKGKGLYGYSNIYKINENVITIAGRGVNIGIAHARNHKFYPIVRLLILHPKNSENIYFFEYQINKLNFYKESTGVPQLTAPQISIYEVAFPSILEQQKVANFLSLIDERIQTQNKIIRESDVLKNVISQRIFSQELRFQDNNGCDFPAWETKKLKEVCDINPKIKSVPNSFYYIDLESVVNGRLLKEDRISKSEAPSRAQRVLAKNDILFQMVRPYQKNNLFFDREGEYVASTGYAQIRAKQSSQFVYQYLHNQRFVDKVIERCTGTSYPAISSTDLGNIEIDHPSLAEQIKIGDFLASIDTKIDLENQLLNKIQDQKKHLLANLFI